VIHVGLKGRKAMKIFCINTNNLVDKDVLSESGGEVQFLDSGEACLEALQESTPDLIVLNTETANLSGFDICKKIREETKLEHLPVLFVSTDSSIDSRLKSYAAGGDDYVVTPIDNSELKAKIKTLLKRKTALDAAKKEVSDVTSSTLDILRSMGEVSAVVHFLQGTCSCNSYESLAKKVIKAHEDLELDVAIQMRVNGEKLHFFTNDVENPLEESVFEYISNKGRLIDFGQRTAINYPYISIIIRNMPTDNKDMHGRVRDHAAIIGQGADSKVKGLLAEMAVKTQRESLLTIINQIETTIVKIDKDYKSQQKSSELILASVSESLEESFLSLALSGEQEEYLRDFVGEAEDKINFIFESGLKLDDEFSVILSQINEALSISFSEETDEVEEEEESIEEETVTLF